MRPVTVAKLIVVALMLAEGTARADEPTPMAFAKTYRACSLVKRVDVAHGGKLTAGARRTLGRVPDAYMRA
jgi:hypothetical protein